MAEALIEFGERGYSLGDYAVEAGSLFDARAQRKLVGPFAITRFTSRSRLAFRRGWPHIRADAADATMLWLVKRGRLRLSGKEAPVVVEPGRLLVTRSMEPFRIECLTDEGGLHDVLNLALPTHVARGLIPDSAATGFCIPAEGAGFAVAEDILTNLLADDDEIAPDTAEILTSGALTAIGHAIRDRYLRGPARPSVSDRRLEDVLRFIEVHLTDPNLSVAMAATGCGISPRRLSHLFKQQDTSFSKIVWERRLAKAKDWLASSGPGDISVAEVAYQVGFKSPAHFSRMFKRAFRVSPSNHRAKG